jgi:predicted transposase YbfD/YdcC
VHGLVDILVIALLSVINGSTGWVDMELFAQGRISWLRTFLALPGGVPSEDTFRRVFEAIDPKEFGDAMAMIIEDLARDLRNKVVAIDGKTMRGSLDRRRGLSALHVVSAWVSELGISLGQISVEEKSNEITAIPELIKTLDVRGATITIDAMGCQKAIAKTIVEAGADYILAVKENHPKLHTAAEVAFTDEPGDEALSIVDDEHGTEGKKAHGRVERRRVRVTRRIDWIDDIEAWKGAKSLVEVERTRQVGDKTSVERAYYISTLELGAEELGKRIRSHWRIENSLHWVLDVTYGEDKSRIRSRNGAANLNALRKLSASLLLRTPAHKSKSVAQRRKLAGWVPDYAFDVLQAISAK